MAATAVVSSTAADKPPRRPKEPVPAPPVPSAPPAVASSRKEMYESFHAWALKTYGDSAKTKTVTRKKYNRITKILKGEEQNSAENSKFRFWVKAKGFRIGPPENHPNHDVRSEQVLFVPYSQSKDPENPEEAVFKKVAVVENFFEIIYNVHVEMEGRSGKHAGQKRTYKAIAETYAFLPREAVTKFLMQCADCQKRMHAGNEGNAKNGSSATTTGNSNASGANGSGNGNGNGSGNNNVSGANGTSSSQTSAGHSVRASGTLSPDPETGSGIVCNNSACALVPPPQDPPQIDFSLPITTTYLKHMRSLGYTEEDALNPDREDSLSNADSDSSGDTSTPLIISDSSPPTHGEGPEVPSSMRTSSPKYANGAHYVTEHSYDKPVNMATNCGPLDAPGSPTPWQQQPPCTPVGVRSNATALNMSKNNSDLRDHAADVRSLQDHTYDESVVSPCNGRHFRDTTATPEDLSGGTKEDDDEEDDDADDKLDIQKYDPERLKAFNMFVRLFVDENLDRMVPISKQPKEKIQAIIDSCNRQFPEFAERARKRIRTYLKSCRRTKRTRDQNGWDVARPTPPHLTSAMAEQILAAACDNESNNAKRMRLGLEPIYAPLPSAQVDKENNVRIKPEPVDGLNRLSGRLSPVALPRVSPQLNGALVGPNPNVSPYGSSPIPSNNNAISSTLLNSSHPQPLQASPANNNINGTQTQILRDYLQRPTDLSVKKPMTSPPNGSAKCNLNPSEVLAVKQLIAGYRESAAFLLRSADELEQLLLQQN